MRCGLDPVQLELQDFTGPWNYWVAESRAEKPDRHVKADYCVKVETSMWRMSRFDVVTVNFVVQKYGVG